MELIVNFLILIFSFLVLAKSASVIVKNASVLARKFHVSEFSLGFFVLGLATTTPELFVGINSAIAGNPELSLGNLVGASIVLLTLVIGLNAVISGEVHFIKSFKRKEMWLTSFVIISPLLLVFDGVLSRIDGIFLLALYVVFYLVMNREQSFIEKIEQALNHHQNHVQKQVVFLGLALAGLVVGGKILVITSENLAVQLNLPLVLLGLLILSVGTNLPELIVLLTSILKHHQQISIGDFLGSAVANTLVLALVTLIHPIILSNPIKVYLSGGMLLLTLVTFNAFFLIDKKLHRLEGLALLTMYGLFILSELFLTK